MQRTDTGGKLKELVEIVIAEKVCRCYHGHGTVLRVFVSS
jgi:hypothetical protein